MPLTKLTSTDAFVVTDIPNVPATGVVRMGKKILQSSAKDLARSATYTFAVFGMERSGASAGINAEGEAEAEALASFVDEVASLDGIDLNPGKGVTASQLASLQPAVSGLDTQSLTVAGVVAAATWAVGGPLTGVRIAVEGSGSNPTADVVASGLGDAGATVVAPEPGAKPWAIWGSEADILVAGSKPGVLNHQGAAMVKANTVVPWGPIPVTTKAYLMLERAGTTVIPDFVSAAGGLVGAYVGTTTSLTSERSEAVQNRILEILGACASHEEGVLMGAFVRAEDFLAGWTDFSPFGRPLAA
ncbi:MAG: hypothetical protein ACN4GZ_20325 [Acidimicrobiales bacterium]